MSTVMEVAAEKDTGPVPAEKTVETASPVDWDQAASPGDWGAAKVDSPLCARPVRTKDPVVAKSNRSSLLRPAPQTKKPDRRWSMETDRSKLTVEMLEGDHGEGRRPRIRRASEGSKIRFNPQVTIHEEAVS